jgi:hypothetical protein
LAALRWVGKSTATANHRKRDKAGTQWYASIQASRDTVVFAEGREWQIEYRAAIARRSVVESGEGIADRCEEEFSRYDSKP